MIQYPRLERVAGILVNPTGRSSAVGRSQMKTRRGTSWSGEHGLREPCPTGVARFKNPTLCKADKRFPVWSACSLSGGDASRMLRVCASSVRNGPQRRKASATSGCTMIRRSPRSLWRMTEPAGPASMRTPLKLHKDSADWSRGAVPSAAEKLKSVITIWVHRQAPQCTVTASEGLAKGPQCKVVFASRQVYFYRHRRWVKDA